MIIAKVSFSYDRGVAPNQKKDIVVSRQSDTPDAVEAVTVVPKGAETPQGGVVRGHGSHFKSRQDQERAALCGAEERRARRELGRAFVASAIPGCYVLPDHDAADRLLAELNLYSGIETTASVYDMTPGRGLPPREITEWTDRIREQLLNAPLGRSKEAAAAGLDVLDRLIACPILTEDAKTSLREMIAAARLNKIERVEFKRRLSEVKLDLTVGVAVAPRRVGVSQPVAADAPAA